VVTLAPLTAQDRDEWQVLWRGYLEFYGTDLSAATTEATFLRLVADDGVLQGALARDEQGRAVGLVHWLAHPATWTTGDYCYLEDLFVAPDARTGGVGSALIAHVRGWAEGKGCAKVYWLTAESNAVARSLYERVATRSGMLQYQIPLGGDGG
jgi:GNAT superfamily N-acetyltransferase